MNFLIQYSPSCHFERRGKSKGQIPHGTARVQVSEPLRAYVGPQERPKGEYAPEFITHGVAMGYYDAALPGLWGIGSLPKVEMTKGTSGDWHHF